MTGAPFPIRAADPESDAAAVADIYRPAVQTGVASFEEVAPGAEEMAGRMRATLERLPWLVAVESEARRVVGYAYAGPHRERAGYRWSVDISVYVHAEQHGKGIGRALYGELLAMLRRQGYVNAFAGITLPNNASVALHQSIGMSLVGVYRGAGFKFGAWRDVAWYGMRLAEPDGHPVEPIPFPLLGTERQPGGG